MGQIEFGATLHIRDGIPQGMDAEFLDGDEEVDVLVTADCTPYVPAKLWGPPEDCYPEEGGDVEILTIHREDNKEEIVSYPLPQGVEDYLIEQAGEELNRLDELAAEYKAEAILESRMDDYY